MAGRTKREEVGARPGPSLVETVEDFLAEAAGGLGRSEKTVRELRNHLRAYTRDLAEVLGTEEGEVPLLVSRTDVNRAITRWRFSPDRRYQGGEAPGERSALTVRRRVSAVRALYEWGVQEGHLPSSPAASLRAPSVPEATPVAVEATQAQDLLRAARAGRWSSRDVLLVALHLTCGLTLSEVAGLTLGSLLGDPPTRVSVTGRNGRRTVALSPLARGALETYLQEREALLVRHGLTSSRLLLSGRTRRVGRARDGSPRLTLEPSRDSLGEALGRVLVRAGIDERGVGSQALRVAFARSALEAGSHTVHALQSQLGHTSLAPLRQWVHSDEDELTRAMEAHPLGQLTP